MTVSKKGIPYLLFIFAFIIPNFATAFGLNCFVVDGPANLRETPTGKVLLSIPDGSTLCENINGEKSKDWSEVLGYKTAGSRIVAIRSGDAEVSEKDFVSGWLHSKNRKRVPFEQFIKIDSLAALANAAQENGQDHFTVKSSSVCGCAKFYRPRHDQTDFTLFTPTKNSILGLDCKKNSKIVSCINSDIGGETTILCPLNCVQVTPSVSLTNEDRVKKFRNESEVAKKKLELKLSHALISDVNRKYPNWLALLLPERMRNSNYDYSVISIPSALKEKDREILIFFANQKDAQSQTPTIAIKENAKVTYQIFPFSLSPLGTEAEDAPNVCLAKSKPSMVVACRNLDELSPPIGLFDYNDSKRNLVPFESLPESKENAGNSCCVRESFIQFSN